MSDENAKEPNVICRIAVMMIQPKEVVRVELAPPVPEGWQPAIMSSKRADIRLVRWDERIAVLENLSNGPRAVAVAVVPKRAVQLLGIPWKEVSTAFLKAIQTPEGRAYVAKSALKQALHKLQEILE